LIAEAIMVERDISIWNQKMYMDNPLIVKEDALISKHRRWYSQFYSKQSKSVAQEQEKTESFEQKNKV
jgi:cholesterol 7-dehydrogenase